MAIDVPAKLGIVGAGPAGLEAALYARFLGYDVLLWEQGEPAERLRVDERAPLGRFGELSSTLGRAALAAQAPDRRLPSLTTPLTASQWREDYLLPLSQCDLVVDCLRSPATVTRIAKEHLQGVELCGFERGEYDFLVETRDAAGAVTTQTVDALIDASGCVLRGETQYADFQFCDGLHLRCDPQTGEPQVDESYGDAFPEGTLLTAASKPLVLHEPNYYVIGAKRYPGRPSFAFSEILDQIRALFTILGDRTTLDLYATAVTLPQ